jgi:hypothetical protein
MKLPKFEDYKAPWEVDLKEGDEPTFDFEKGKRYLYNVLSDKEKAQNTLVDVTAERDTLKSEKEAAAREGETEVDRLKRERDEALAEAKKAKETPEGPTPAELRLTVALEKGLTAVQAKRLMGNTKEELEADADELVASFGGAGTGDDDDEDDGPRQRPRRQYRTGGDPGEGSESAFDPDKEADAYIGQGFLG